MKFPQYRKYVNGKSYFKIHSLESFEEIQFLGDKQLSMEFQAKTFVDRNLIQDMLDCLEGRWVVIEEEEYQQIKD